MQSMINHLTLTFGQVQSSNDQIYGLMNGRICDSHDFAVRISRHIGILSKGGRGGDHDKIIANIAPILSWTAALANRLSIDLDHELWQRFPGKCPYCTYAPCDCKGKRAKNRTQVLPDMKAKKPEYVWEYQKMFESIYPNGNLTDSIGHLVEEAMEVGEALQILKSSPNNDTFEEVVLELTDIVSNLLAVANHAHVDISTRFVKTYLHGCPSCNDPICTCWFKPVVTTAEVHT